MRRADLGNARTVETPEVPVPDEAAPAAAASGRRRFSGLRRVPRGEPLQEGRDAGDEHLRDVRFLQKKRRRFSGPELRYSGYLFGTFGM